MGGDLDADDAGVHVSLAMAVAVLEEAEFAGVALEAPDLSLRLMSRRATWVPSLVIHVGKGEDVSVDPTRPTPKGKGYWVVRGVWDDEARTVGDAARFTIRQLVYGRLKYHSRIEGSRKWRGLVQETRLAAEAVGISGLGVTGLARAPFDVRASEVTLLTDPQGYGNVLLGRVTGDAQPYKVWYVGPDRLLLLDQDIYQEDVINSGLDKMMLNRLGIGRHP